MNLQFVSGKQWSAGLVLCLFLASCAAPTAAPTPAAGGPGLPLSDCHLSAAGQSDRQAAECGTLTVPENPADPAGGQISLRVAVLRARGRNPAADPLFFLTGGPGQAATESYLQLQGAFAEINRKRDIVLVDQRGTGQSNPLDCPVIEDPLAVDTLEEAASAAQACADSLEADPRFYTTALAMDDLDRVRAALGYDQINLYGVSYGTRAALAYLRQYPARVRAVILDGVVPPEEILGMDVARDAQRALDLMFDRCAAEAECGTAFPDLRADFAALAAQLDAAPAPVALDDPLTGEPVEFAFTYDMFAGTVRLLSYAPETVALLPLLIHTAAERGDLTPLAAQSLLVGGQLAESISQGMGNSVLCSEDTPFLDPSQAEALNAGTYLRNAQTDQLLALCANWPRGDVPPDVHAPVSANVPVLLLSGEADPVTPPENGEQVAAALPNSLHLVAPGMGHNVIMRGCLPRLAADFIETVTLATLDPACVGEIRPMPFFIDFTGPAP
jgi:pimeloyl-ACP methyl ester carboxylesterase